MNKKLFFFLFLFLIFPKFIWAETLSSQEPYCENKLSQANLANLYKVKIKNIEVNIKNDRKWKKNSLRILIGNFRFIPEKFKKRFKANVIVKFENNLLCSFKATVRHNGDQKDHIVLEENSIIQSIDVHLKTGHIYGITKFKLLRPVTRGNFKDEIFVTELLREFNYLAPRTSYVDAKINEVESKMLFQEKATKELLEYNLRREGPIHEGDERYLWRLAQKVPSNQLSNHSAGIVPLMKAGFNALLARQSNTKLISKSKKHASMSFNALSNLNVIYLLYSNMYDVSKINYLETYRYYTLNNELLGFREYENVLKLDVYSLLIQSANGHHGLAPNNRKFYWNSVENFFEPINYDSNFNIDRELVHILLPASNQITDAFFKLENLLDDINVTELNNKLNFRGLDINISDTEKKVNKLKNNFNKLKDIYLNYNKEIIDYNKINKIDSTMWNKYLDSIQKINPNVILVKQNNENSLFQVCKEFSNCYEQSFSDEQIIELLNGGLIINDIEYQYLGKNTEINDLINNFDYKYIKLQNSKFYFNKDITYNFDKINNEFNIYQSEPGSRAFFIKGDLKDININFYGDKKEEIILDKLKNYPININGLTACLSFLNLNFDNVKIRSSNSTCEDSVNFIKTSGNVQEIDIRDSLRDGLDIDFSKIKINSITVQSSGNDCVDLSFGHYQLDYLNLSNCGDKGLSVGEKSKLKLNDIIINEAETGIAVKDSSVVTANKLSMKKTARCLDIYRKKQEFSGGILNLNNLNCESGRIDIGAGSFINYQM